MGWVDKVLVRAGVDSADAGADSAGADSDGAEAAGEETALDSAGLETTGALDFGAEATGIGDVAPALLIGAGVMLLIAATGVDETS